VLVLLFSKAISGFMQSKGSVSLSFSSEKNMIKLFKKVDGVPVFNETKVSTSIYATYVSDQVDVVVVLLCTSKR
jgi:hypothetical protein